MGDRITGTERRLAGAGWPGGGAPVRPSSSSSSSSFPHQPPACARRATCRARQLGDPGPRASARRAPWTGRCPWPWGAAGWSGQWRRASDRILIFRLGRAGAGRGGVGRDASADRIPPVPRADGTARRPRGVAGRDGRGWNGNASAARSGRGRCRSRRKSISRMSGARRVAAAFVGWWRWTVPGVGRESQCGVRGAHSQRMRKAGAGALVFPRQPAGRARQAGGRAPAVQLRLVATSIHGTRRPTPTSLSVSTCPRLVALSSVRGSGEARHLSSSLFLPLAWPRARSLDRLPCKATRLRCNLHKRSGFTRSILSLLRQAVDYSVRDGNQLPSGTRWTGCCRAHICGARTITVVVVVVGGSTVTGNITGLACRPEK